ncbi:MAG: phytanoyl-CoA dioxygenase family protein [Pseudomonadales bacterium]|nr:phytanoyl-CoA dioxygenase family protein [Pseudomonadales bacterium]
MGKAIPLAARAKHLFSLNQSEMNQYARDGFLIRPAVFNSAELVTFRSAAERAVAVAYERCHDGHTYILDGHRFVDSDYLTVQFEHQLDSDTIRVIEPVHELDPVLETLVDNPKIVAPMCDLVGQTDLALWTAKLNLKRPQEGSGFGWHQDSPYWLHASSYVDLMPNVLVAFDDANQHNGCLRVIRGSHKKGCLAGKNDGSMLSGFFTDPTLFNEVDQVCLEVPAGSLVFFSQHAIHGSLPNTSDFPRRALIMTYQPANQPALKSGQVRNTPLFFN